MSTVSTSMGNKGIVVHTLVFRAPGDWQEKVQDSIRISSGFLWYLAPDPVTEEEATRNRFPCFSPISLQPKASYMLSSRCSTTEPWGDSRQMLYRWATLLAHYCYINIYFRERCVGIPTLTSTSICDFCFSFLLLFWYHVRSRRGIFYIWIDFRITL